MAESSCGTGCLGLDLLVGSNYYWTLVTEAVKRGSAGPIAMETRVGWVLSGPMDDPSLFMNFISLESNHRLYVDNDDNSLIELGLNTFWNLESHQFIKIFVTLSPLKMAITRSNYLGEMSMVSCMITLN